LCYWMRESGFSDLLPTLRAVYVGLSAGSVVMAPNIGQHFVTWMPPNGGDTTLGLVDFAMFPHLDNPELRRHTLADAKRWATGMSVPGYAMDDATAIKVAGGAVEVISEGQWRLFTPSY
jgi:dipeptidase E